MGPHVKPLWSNVGVFERVLSGVTGSALLLINRNKPNTTIQKAAGAYLLMRGATGYCMLYDLLQRDPIDLKTHNVNVKTKIIVNRPTHEVYRFWRQIENLPLFMKHLNYVKVLDEHHSEWSVNLPGIPGHITWQSEIVLDEVDQRIGWQSLTGSTLMNAGNVHFKDLGNATEINVALSYAPSGKLTEEVSKLFRPMFKKMVKKDIADFKKFMESGRELSATNY